MNLPLGNLFAENPAADTQDTAGAEFFETLLQSGGLRLERIISHGASSPDGFWYDQAEDEWVALLQGQATLEFDDGTMVALTAGSHLTIPAHVRHRVHRTSRDAIWLALFLRV